MAPIQLPCLVNGCDFKTVELEYAEAKEQQAEHMRYQHPIISTDYITHKMCGGFTVIYILVSFLMIGVAVHGKVSGIVTSLPIVGGITACGVFLLMISVIGLIGAVRHHQVLLFFYMVVLFLIFLIQFSCSCAALAINENDEKMLIKKAWTTAESKSPSLVVQAEQTFDCCGLGVNATTNKLYLKPTKADLNFTDANNVFDNYPDAKCYHAPGTPLQFICRTCYSHINDKVNSGFSIAGGLGLFFSFTELFGGIVAARYRNLLNPFASGPAGAPFAGGT